MPVGDGKQSGTLVSKLDLVFDGKKGTPEVVSCNESAGSIDICFDLETDLIWFPGHFPGTPVLPGIVQLHWAVLAASCLFGFDSVPDTVSRLKFKKVVVPPRQLFLRLEAGSSGQIQFKFSSGQDQHSLGTLIFPTVDSC